MAIAATAVCEVRGGSGSDTNGGFFDPGVTSPGTDYSQQNGAQVTLDGTTVKGALSGAVMTLTGHTVSLSEIGNGFNLSGGTGATTGFYIITAASTGSNTWTLDRAPGGTGTNIAGIMGGALNTISKALANISAGNWIWVKASATYTITSALVSSVGGGDKPTYLIGYTSTRGDNGKATIACSTNSVIMIQTNANNCVFQNLFLSNTAGTPSDGFRASSGQVWGCAIVRCKISGCAMGVNGNNGSSTWYYTGLLVDSCEITGCTSDGVNNTGYTTIFASYIHGNTGNGYNGSAAGSIAFLLNSVFKSNGGGCYLTGVNQASFLTVNKCIFINNTGDGIQTLATTTLHPQIMVWNSVFDSNGGWGMNFSGTTSWAMGPSLRNNFWGSGSTANTSGDLNGPSKDAQDATYSGDPFTSRSTGDFSLTGTAGAVLKGAGFPVQIPG